MLGVVHYAGQIVVAYDSSRPLSILSDVPPYDELFTIEIDGLQRAQDLVVCTESRQLFIADWWGIWRTPAPLPSDNSKTDTVCMKTDCRVWTLSTRSSLLAVTTYDNNCLFVYETTDNGDSRPPKRVQLPDNMYPHHAAVTKDRTFVVCHVPYLSTDDNGFERYRQVRPYIICSTLKSITFLNEKKRR